MEVKLNLLEPTATKRALLLELEKVYKETLSYVISRGGEGKHIDLQKRFCDEVREHHGLHSQIVNDLFKDASSILNNGGDVGRVSIPYNIPRSGKFDETGRGNPVVVIATLEGRIAIPVVRDGAYQRFREVVRECYVCTHFKLSHR